MRLAGRWQLLRPIILLAALGVASLYVYRPTLEDRGWERVTLTLALCGESWGAAAGCVVDGDTLVIGSGQARRRIRIIGYDAPELKGSCEAEHAAALRAKTALHDWLAMGPFEWSGADDPPYDQYGRELREIRRVSADGTAEFLADLMIENDLASASGWGASEIDWCE